MDHQAALGPKKSEGTFFYPVCIFCFALALRFIYLVLLHGDKGLSSILPLDSSYYLQRATEILGGDLFGKGPAFQSGIIYPYLLALLQANKQAIIIVQILASSLAATFAYYCGSFINGKGTGLIAGMLYSTCSVFIFDSANILFDTWVLFSVMLTMMATYRAVSSGKNYWWLTCGIALAFAGTAKPFVLIYLPLLLVFWFIPVYTPSKAILVKAVVFLAVGVLLVLAPISMRNWSVSKQWSPFPATGGFTAFIGNNPQATGLVSIPRYLGVHNGERYADSTLSYPSEVLGHQVTYDEASKFWMQKVFSYWRTDTKGALRLIVKKAALLLNNSEFDDNYSFEFFHSHNILLKLLPTAGFLIAPALLGLYFGLRRWSKAAPVVIMSGIYLSTLPLILIVGRYRYPMLGAFTVLAALAIVEIASRFKAGKYPQVAASLAVIIAGAILTNSTIASERDLGNSQEETLAELASAYIDGHDPATALKISEEGLSNKRVGVLFYQRGRSLHMLGRDMEALESIKLAIQLEPSLEEAHASLEQLCTQLQDPRETELKRLAENQASSENLQRLGLYYLQQCRYDNAIRQFDKLRQQGFNETETLKMLSTAYLRRGKPKEGIECLKSLAKTHPNDADILANLAFAYFDVGNFEVSEKTFLAARRLNPDQKLVHYGLGLIYRYSNRLSQAHAEFQTFLAMENPESTWYKEAQTQFEQISSQIGSTR